MSFPRKMLFCCSCCVAGLMCSKPEKNRKEAIQTTLLFIFSAPGEDPFPGIIDIHGYIGGLSEHRASLLANHGFATLALAYFSYEDLPREPTELHLEYFEEALNYMLQHPQVGAPSMSPWVSLGLLLLQSACPFVRVSSGGSCRNGHATLWLAAASSLGSWALGKRKGQPDIHWNGSGGTSQSNLTRDR